jgi:processive 1,2-diacylglycerol beta-glucosyltransferase
MACTFILPLNSRDMLKKRLGGGYLMQRPTALILTAHYGSGHIQVANVLADELRNNGYEPIISDLFGESYPRMSQITQSLFLKSFSYGTSFYKWWYYGTNKLNGKGIAQFSRYLGRKRLQELITKHRPQFVISTFPLNSAPFLIKKAKYSIPTYTVITDYCAHPFWINPLIDHYFVAADIVKNGLVEHNVDEKRITVSGIPIGSEFYSIADKPSIFRKYQITPSNRVVTVLAGAQGVLKNVKDLAKLLLKNPSLQVIIVCGKNKALYEKLLPLAIQHPGSFRLFGYVDNVHEIFQISHCLITKPGGITISEAAALQLPLIFYKPVPGQEAENAQYFSQKGAAVVCHTANEIYDSVQELFDNEQLMTSMKLQLRHIHKGHSSKMITDYAISQSEQRLLILP